MTVNWTKIGMPLGFGVDTKTDPKGLPSNKLEVLENGVFSKLISVTKRNGYRALSNHYGETEILEGSRGVAPYKRELLNFDDNRIYSYSQGMDTWLNKGNFVSLNVTQNTVAYTPFDQTSADSVSEGGLMLYAWQDDGVGIRATVLDSESGAVVLSNYLVSATGTRPRCIAFTGQLFVYFVEQASNMLKVLRLNYEEVALSSNPTPETVIDDLNGTYPNYDVKISGSTGHIVYLTTGNEVNVGKLNANGTLGSPGSGGFPAAVTHAYNADKGLCIAPHPTDDFAFVVCAEGGVGVSIIHIDENFNSIGTYLGTTLNATEPESHLIKNVTAAYSTEVISAGTGTTYPCYIYYEVGSTDTWNHFVRTQRVYSAPDGGAGVVTIDAADKTTRHCGLASHAFDDNGVTYVNILHSSPQQGTYFTINQEGQIIGKYTQGVSGDLVVNNLPSVQTDSRAHRWVGGFKNRLAVDVGEDEQFSEKGIKEFTLDFNHSQSHHSVENGASAFITGGFLHQYDGNVPVETGFHLYPENVSAVGSTTASGSLDTGVTYIYKCQWEWYNAAGERELSTTASGVSLSLSGGDNTVTLTIPTLSITNKTPGRASAIRLAVNRTEGDGTTSYRVDSPVNPTWNNPSVDTISFIDTMADSVLITKELDYTNAELEHVAPPAASVITSTKDRIFLAGFEDPNLVMFSKLRTWGRVAAFNDTFQILVDQEGGPVTGLSSLDDKLIIFKRNKIFVLSGDGPSNTGLEGDSFPPPQIIAGDVGCTNAKSIVTTPLGVMFKSSKGIYLLERGLKLQYIGADVEIYNSQTVTAASLLEDRNLVIFLCSSGKTLVYDYYFNQWGTFTNHTGVSAAFWNGSYVYSKSDGEIRVETPGEYLDVGSSIKLVMETGWISFEAVQGFAKLRRAFILGKYKSPHLLKTKIAYDYEPFFKNILEWDPDLVLNVSIFGDVTAIGDSIFFGDGDSVYGGQESSVYQVRIQMPRQKMEAVKFRFEDVPGVSPGESFELNQLTLEVGIKDTPVKLPNNKSFE